MRKLVLLVVPLLAAVCFAQAWSVKKVADLSDGRNNAGKAVCGDADHDSLPDFSFWRYTDNPALWLWQIIEYRPCGRFDVVQSETCPANPWPDTGIFAGAFIPTDVGDVDGDGLVEYLGYNEHNWADSIKSMVCLYEAQAKGPELYPDSIVWRHEYFEHTDSYFEWFVGDMDRDGLKEVLATNSWHTYVFEARGNNRLDSVFRTPIHHWSYDYAVGDFDQDSATEFVFAPPDPDYAYVYECTGNDQYTFVDSFPQPHGRNGYDAFSGNDVDGDGKPEFFIKYNQYTGSISNYRLLMYEATGNNEYEATEIDSAFGVSGWPDDAGASCCADVDGDGVEEVVVSYDASVRVLKATGNNQFARKWEWVNRSSGDPQSQVTCYDMNRNGYQDIVISGNGHTWMYEKEGVRVLAPNGGQSLVPGEGCTIRWRVYTPPRCDSVSLFLRRDSTWDLDTIATGLAPTESSYNWVVSPGAVDSGRIVAIAYGPGWLFDESDSTFSILPGGCEEVPAASLRNWALWVWPNPATSQARVRFDVPHQANVDVSVLDACGRVVRTLASGELAPGHYERRLDAGTALPAGVYVLHLAADGMRLSRKVVLTGR